MSRISEGAGGTTGGRAGICRSCGLRIMPDEEYFERGDDVHHKQCPDDEEPDTQRST